MSSCRFRKWKPSAVENLLIQAAFSKGDKAIISWESWKKNVNWVTINKSSVNIFPFVYKNLSPLIDDPLWPKFKGVHLKIWSWNNLLFEKIKPALQLLNDQQIPFLILKGGALLYRYSNLGLRNSNDYDLLVKPEDFLKTINLLQQNSWKPEEDDLLSGIKIKREIHLCKENLYTIDLHQRPIHLTAHPELQQCLWQYQEKFNFFGESLCRPADTEMLFIILAHGFRIGPDKSPKSLYWIADALLIMEDITTIDWDRFCFLAKQTSLRYVLGAALSYFVNNNLTAAIPQKVINDLTLGSATKEERVMYAFSLHPSFLFYRQNRFQRIINFYVLYLFFNGKINLSDKRQILKYIFGLPQHLMYSRGANSYLELIIILFKKVNKYFFKTRPPLKSMAEDNSLMIKNKS